MRRTRVIVLAFGVLGGCAGNDSTITATLTEHEIALDSSALDAGEVTFEISNVGEETHELVVVRTSLGPDSLPQAADGSFDEEQVEVVDEVEDLEAGNDESLTIELAAGSYVLACNIVEEEDGETEAHYDLGMHTSLEVS